MRWSDNWNTCSRCSNRIYVRELRRIFNGPLTKINSLATGKFEWNFRYVIFKWILVIDGWGISGEIVLIWMSLHWWSVNIVSGNGLVLSGNKPLPEPMLTQISRHMASLGHNELTKINFQFFFLLYFTLVLEYPPHLLSCSSWWQTSCDQVHRTWWWLSQSHTTWWRPDCL